MRALIDLSGPSFGPVRGGKPRELVILLHGYGADGNDLLGLAPHWARLLPDTQFVALLTDVGQERRATTRSVMSDMIRPSSKSLGV